MAADRVSTSSPTPLLEQSQALSTYLDCLFRQWPADTSAQPEVATGTVVLDLQSVETAAAVPEIAVAAPDAVAAAAAEFGTAPFSMLMVNVGGARLGLPMRRLFGIRRQPAKLARLPGSPPWILGLLREQQAQLRIVDAEQVLGSHTAGTLAHNEQRHVVIIAAGRWALSCEHIERVIRIDPCAARWQSPRAQPWYAGVVADELCTLVDLPALVCWLDAQV